MAYQDRKVLRITLYNSDGHLWKFLHGLIYWVVFLDLPVVYHLLFGAVIPPEYQG
jgi:hypothetical protein